MLQLSVKKSIVVLDNEIIGVVGSGRDITDYRENLIRNNQEDIFKVNEFINVYNSLSEGEKTILTDATKVYVMREKKVALVEGESYNIKITTKYDLKMANLMINNMNEE